MLPWERGRLVRKAESAAGRGLDARDTLILAFSHKGRRDPLVAIRTWFRMTGLSPSPRPPMRFEFSLGRADVRAR